MIAKKADNILGIDWYVIPINHCKNYLIDEQGRIYSKRRKYTRQRKDRTIVQSVGGMILTPSKHKYGYDMYNLTLDCKRKTFYRHELVAETFLGQRPEGHHICHCDGDASNNLYTNLRYDTPKGNAADRHTHGTDAKGVNNPVSKYTEDVIANIKYLLFVENMSQKYVSEYFNVPYSTIGSIKQKHRWIHVEPKKPS